MGKVLDEDLVYEILSVVAEIPVGYVASYGQIARLIGREKNSRLVGAVRIATAIIRATASSTTRDASRQTSPTSEQC